jgi:hypothetical protein
VAMLKYMGMIETNQNWLHEEIMSKLKKRLRAY